MVIITRKRLRLKPWAFYTFSIIFATLIIFSSTKLFFWQEDNKDISRLEEEIKEMTEVTIIEEEGNLVNPPDEETEKEEVISDYWYYVSFPFYEVDFTNLIKKNEDTIAYIHMENTNVNYPVVQSKDNNYYLTHAFDKSKNNAGWVFMDYRNTLTPMSDNVVIYGHGRVDNTVFGSLKKTLTKDWQKNKDNFIINLSTPSNNYVYQIFSIYTIEAESYYIKTKFANQEEKQTWIDTMIERNTASNIETTLDTNDKILTLSTCYNDDGIRIVVQAKLIKSSN